MVFKEVEVKKDGFSGADAQTIVQRAMRFDSEITFEKGSRKINAKSIMGVVSAGFKKGDKCMVIVSGDDCTEAAEEMCRLFENRFKI